MKIEIKYDGEYPNLCGGHLEVTIDGVYYDFGKFCLSSGGGIYSSKDWDMWATQGEWSVEYPKDFPEELKESLFDAINSKIPHGCCGGCI